MRSKISKAALGNFQIVSGKVRMTDPCYDVDTWCSGEVEDVKCGTWLATVYHFDEQEWGIRNGYLLVTHESYMFNPELADWEKVDFEVGVDSGQAGIFDSQYYKDGSVVPGPVNSNYGDCDVSEDWYGMCCDQTLDTEHSAGIVPYGVVSSSGYGDGGYEGLIIKQGGEVVAMMIDFGLDRMRDVMVQLVTKQDEEFSD